MADFINLLTNYTFIQNAVLASVLASIACGITGSFVVKNKMTFVSGGLAHAIMGGIGIAYFFKIPTSVGAIAFALLFSAIITFAKNSAKQEIDTLIGVLWAVGMSIGIIFMYLTPGYNADLISFIFGNILMVDSGGVTAIALIDVVILLLVTVFYNHFLYISFDEEFLRVKGLPVKLIYFILLTMISLTIVILIKIVGLILVIALLTMPSVISGIFQKKMHNIIILSIILGIVFTLGGLLVAFKLNLPVSATIIIIGGISYIASLLVKSSKLFKGRN